jgi:hypothetical protein
MKRVVPLLALILIAWIAITPTLKPLATITNDQSNLTVPDSSLNRPDPSVDPFTTPDGQRKQDWLDAIEVFAERFPTYGGYAITPDRKRLILYTAATDPQAENAAEIHTAFVTLIAQTTGFPEATNGQGKTVEVKNLEYVMARVKYPMSTLYVWRIKVRDLMYRGLINSLSISDGENVINVQIPKESDRATVMKFLDENGIPADVVRFKIGVNMPL